MNTMTYVVFEEPLQQMIQFFFFDIISQQQSYQNKRMETQSQFN